MSGTGYCTAFDNRLTWVLLWILFTKLSHWTASSSIDSILPCRGSWLALNRIEPTAVISRSSLQPPSSCHWNALRTNQFLQTEPIRAQAPHRSFLHCTVMSWRSNSRPWFLSHACWHTCVSYKTSLLPTNMAQITTMVATLQHQYNHLCRLAQLDEQQWPQHLRQSKQWIAHSDVQYLRKIEFTVATMLPQPFLCIVHFCTC